MKLWVDDIRDAPDNTWVEARKVEQAIKLLAIYHCTEISLDHDIENRPDNETFKPVAYFFGEKYCRMREDIMLPPKATVHSDNPVGAKEIQAILHDYGIEAPWVPFTSNKEFKTKYGLS